VNGLTSIIETVHSHLDAAGIPHAFGGALALAYAVEHPRATADVDLNVFVPAGEARTTFEALPDGVSWDDGHVSAVERDGQVRVFAGHTPLDLFFNTAGFHEQVARNTVVVPFGDVTIPVLAPNDLAVFKAFFDRPRDWVDLQAMADAGSLDEDVVAGWLRRLLGADDPRIGRLKTTFEQAAEPDGDDDVVVRFPPSAGR
jgi:pimeloyl-ACP methyl ester carboxylesterase